MAGLFCMFFQKIFLKVLQILLNNEKIRLENSKYICYNRFHM